MNVDLLLDPTISMRLCLTLLHSLWQMAWLAVVVWVTSRLLRRRSVERSYAMHVAALVAGLAVLPVTYTLVDVPTPEGSTAAVRALPATSTAFPDETVVTPAIPARIDRSIPPATLAPQLSSLPIVSSAPVDPVTSGVADQHPADPPHPAARWIVLVYALGVMVMLLRLTIGLWSAHRLATKATALRDGPIVDLLTSVARQWSMRVTPALAVAEHVVIPKVVGLLRPTILLPASAVTGLSADELQMILAHELAHIRRHDLWVNLLQRLAETVLFFNPALWYLSRRISMLREFCCDELTCLAMFPSIDGASSQTGDLRPPLAADPRTRYAAALVRVAELSQHTIRERHAHGPSELTTLAAAGRSPSDLRRRIAHLFGEPIREPLRLSRGGVCTIAALAALFTFGLPLLPSRAQPTDGDKVNDKASERPDDEAPADAVHQFSFGGKVEVVALGTHGETPERWWGAEGQLLESVPFTWHQGSIVEADGVPRRLVYRINQLPKDAEVTWKIVGCHGSAGGNVEFDDEQTPGRYFTRYFLVPEDQKTVQLRVGVAIGVWNTVADMRVEGTQARSLRDGKSVVYSGAFDTPRGVVAVVSHNYFDTNFRIVAVDKRGVIHDSTGRGGVSAGAIYQTKSTFPNLMSNEIDHFEFQTRDYEWLEIDDLPLNPKPAGPAPQAGEGKENLQSSSPALPSGAQSIDRDKPSDKSDGEAPVDAAHRFSFGGQVEVVAIGTHEEVSQRWWDAEGRPLESVPFTWHQGSPLMGRRSEQIAVGFPVRHSIVCRIDQVPKDAEVKWGVSPCASVGGMAYASFHEQPAAARNWTQVLFTRRGQKTVRLRVGVATGPWKTVVQTNGAGAYNGRLDDKRRFVYSGALDSPQGTVAVVSHDFSDTNFRMVAFNKQGATFESTHSGNNSDGIHQSRFTFRDLTANEIDHLEFQTRDYEWVEINDLPLNPIEANAGLTSPVNALVEPSAPTDAVASMTSEERHKRVAGILHEMPNRSFLAGDYQTRQARKKVGRPATVRDEEPAGADEAAVASGGALPDLGPGEPAYEDAWCELFRELVMMGPDVVPQLCEELDASDDQMVHRRLAFALRAIGDPRAVPALIRCLPKTLLPQRYSDSGLKVKDPELLKFMQQHDLDEGTGDDFGFGRSVREVCGALQKLTGQDFDDQSLYFMFLSKDPRRQELQRELFRKQAERWETWWEANSHKLLKDNTHATVNLPGEPHPPEAPTIVLTKESKVGDRVLGMVLSPAGEGHFHFLDLDTGSHPKWPQEIPQEESPRVQGDLAAWAARNGIDLMCVTHRDRVGTETYVLKALNAWFWEVSSDEVDTLKDPNAQRTFPTGKPVGELLLHFDEKTQRYDPKVYGYFVYATQQGGMGIIRVTDRVTRVKDLTGNIGDPPPGVGFHKGVRFNHETITP